MLCDKNLKREMALIMPTHNVVLWAIWLVYPTIKVFQSIKKYFIHVKGKATLFKSCEIKLTANDIISLYSSHDETDRRAVI